MSLQNSNRFALDGLRKIVVKKHASLTQSHNYYQILDLMGNICNFKLVLALVVKP
jgi:hypothetical protein